VHTANREEVAIPGDTVAPLPKPHLLRVLGAVFGIAVAIGSMVGAGILRAPGSVAHAVPSIGWIFGLWGFAILHALLSANVYAELFTSVPCAGGPYIPVRRAFGDLPALLTGASDALNNAASSAALALAGVDFLALTWPVLGSYPVSVAMAIIGALFAINALGVREGRAAQIAMTGIKIGILIAIAACALLLPSAPKGISAALPTVGAAGAIAAYQLISGAFSGWGNAIYFVEEDVAPSRNIPLALAGSIIGVGILYLLINAALLRVSTVAGLASQQVPVGTLIGRLAGDLGPALLGLTGFILILGCCHGGLMAAPRIIYGMSRDRLLPAFAAQVSRGGTPQIGLLIISLGSAAMAVTGSFEAAFRVVATTGVAMAFVLDLALFTLRLREPDLRRPFPAWGYPWLPCAALILDLAFFVSILWFDPLSGVITVGTLGAVSLIWLIVRKSTGVRRLPSVVKR
jgi:APA family basic amino acid/polyamine antiporter